MAFQRKTCNGRGQHTGDGILAARSLLLMLNGGDIKDDGKRSDESQRDAYLFYLLLQLLVISVQGFCTSLCIFSLGPKRLNTLFRAQVVKRFEEN